MELSDGPQSEPVVPHPPLQDYYPSEEERRPFLDGLFDSTAQHYDRICRVMSFGSGEWYRKEAAKRADMVPGMAVLDVCVGSGQVARPALELVGSEGSLIGVDASLGMLTQASQNVDAPMVQGLAEQLPLAAEIVDFVTMGYALRHVKDLKKTFEEYRRVLKPGGRVLILEFTKPRSRPIYYFARVYLKHVVPWASRIGTGDRNAHTLMRYFWDTIENCVPPETILQALAEAGFEQADCAQTSGIFSEYTAIKPAPPVSQPV